MNKLRVVIAHYHSDVVSGAERAAGDMAVAVSQAFEINMLIPGNGLLSEYYQRRNLNTWNFNVSTPRRKYPGLHLLQSYLFSVQLRRRKIDAVVANTFSAASRISTACKLAQVPYIIYLREYIRDCLLHRNVLRKANYLFAVSRDVAHHLGSMGFSRDVAVVYDNILVDPIVNQLRIYQKNDAKKVLIDSAAPIVGWIGRITAYKQPDIFLKAIPIINKSLPFVRYIVVGKANKSEKAYEQGLKKYAVENGIDQSVLFLGQRDDAIELMSECKVLCMTSRREPFARVVLEAMVIGVPVVAACSGGAPEVVKDRETGILFDACSSDAHEKLAEAVIYLLKNPLLARQISDRAKQDLYDNFASQKPVRDFENHLEGIILRSKAHES